MTTKPLPPIDEELKGERKRIDLKVIRPKGKADDATIEENSRLLGNEWGASTSLQRTARQPRPVLLWHPFGSRFRFTWTMH